MDSSTSMRASSTDNADIKVEYFVPKDNLKMINQWLQGHKLNSIDERDLPDNGVVSTIDGIPHACAFLYKTDSNTCEINGGIVDPKLNKTKRELAIESAITGLEPLARALGFKKIKIHANINRLIGRLKVSGFCDSGNFTLLTKEL